MIEAKARWDEHVCQRVNSLALHMHRPLVTLSNPVLLDGGDDGVRTGGGGDSGGAGGDLPDDSPYVRA